MKAEHNTVLVGLITGVVGILLGLMFSELQDTADKGKLKACYTAINRERIDLKECNTKLKNADRMTEALHSHLFAIVEKTVKVQDNRPK